MQVLVSPAASATASEKVFWFFSSEKNAFFFFVGITPNAGGRSRAAG
jgi:putative SOS response-associated peptidase YedK